jgi:ribonuclease HII
MSENVSKKLTTKQRKALDALLEGAKIKDAALVAGVATRTLQRWREQEAFAFELQRRSTQATKDAARRLTGNMDDMLDVLLELAIDKLGMVPYSVRVRAALGWIDRQAKLVEMADILARLEALEAVVR